MRCLRTSSPLHLLHWKDRRASIRPLRSRREVPGAWRRTSCTCTGAIPSFRSDSAARRGLEDLRQSVAFDPDYSAAWAALACLYLRVGNSDGTDPGLGELETLAEQAALRAVALDDSMVDAHARLGLVRMTDFDAIALGPDYTRSREWLVTVYLWTGLPPEALKEANRATELDPLSPPWGSARGGAADPRRAPGSLAG